MQPQSPAPPLAAPARRAVLLLLPVLLTPLIRLEGFAFQSVVPRAVWFRLTVGVALAALLALLLLRETRFRARDPLLIALGAFVAVQLAAALAGDAPQLSLWGSMVRMWGVVTWIFLLAYYVLLRSLLADRDWTAYLGASLVVSGLVSLLGLLQALGIAGASLRLGERVTATLGNPAYLAAYLLIHVGIGAFLYPGAGRRARGVVGALLALDLAALTLSNTLSAWLGLVAGVLCALAAYTVAAGGRRTYLAWVAAAALAAAVAGTVLLAPESALVQRIPPLRRLAALGPEDPSTYGRFLLWETALKGAADRPLLGAGPESFGNVFSRHFPPSAYGVLLPTYADRAHDVFLEALATSGVLGLLAYAAIWGAFFRQLRRAYRRGRLGGAASLALLFAGVAYLVYLLFWFEDLSSMAAFVCLAAFVSSRAQGGPLVEMHGPDRRVKRVALAALAAIVVAAVVYQRGVRILLAARDLHAAERGSSMMGRMAAYERAVGRGLPEGVGGVQRYAAFLEGLTPQLDAIRADPDRARMVDAATQSALGAMRSVVSMDPRNDLWRLESSGLLRFAALLYRDRAYHDAALEEIRAAIALSPTRVRHHHALADAFLMTGQVDSARAAVERARRLRPDLTETDLVRARVLHAGGDVDGAAAALLRTVDSPPVTLPVADEIYLRVGEELARRGRNAEAARLRMEYDRRVREAR